MTPHRLTSLDLLRYRQAQQLTQEQAAARFGTSQESWSQWEAGKHKVPRWLAKLILETEQ